MLLMFGKPRKTKAYVSLSLQKRKLKLQKNHPPSLLCSLRER